MAPDESLTQDFDAHIPFAFTPVPESPVLANRTARVRRWFFIAFAESWLAVFLFRLKVRLRNAGVPLLPGVCDALSRALFNVSIGNAVEAGSGLMLTHGNVVIDGRTRIGRNCQINPWVTIGLSNSRRYGFSADGPTIGDDVHIGTGAKILGPITVGDFARIGANAVVIDDVASNTTVVGVPARPVGDRPTQTSGIPARSSAGSLRDRIRTSIVDYRLKRQSLRSLVQTIHKSLETESGDHKVVKSAVQHDLAVLEALAETGSASSGEVDRALVAIEAAIGS